MSAATDTGLWCDDFDADLPKVVPHAREILGATGDVELRTYATPTNGKINCPASWHTDHGLTAFFGTPSFGSIAPVGYVGGKDVVACTFWEAVRDEWIHDSVIVVNWRHFIWKPPSDLMMRLMFDLRGWTPLADAERTETVKHVEASLAAAAERLDAVVSGAAGVEGTDTE